MHSNAKDPRWCKCVSKVGNLGAATNAGNYIWEAGKEQGRERTWFLSIFAQDAVMGWSEGAWLLRFLRIFFLCQVGLLKYFALSSNGPFLFWSPFHRLFVGWIEANFRRHSKDFFLILVTKRVVMWFYILSWRLLNVFFSFCSCQMNFRLIWLRRNQ